MNKQISPAKTICIIALAYGKFSISSHCLNPPNNDDDDGHRVWLRNWLICWLSVQGGAAWWAQHTLFNQITVRVLYLDIVYLMHIQISRYMYNISFIRCVLSKYQDRVSTFQVFRVEQLDELNIHSLGKHSKKLFFRNIS